MSNGCCRFFNDVLSQGGFGGMWHILRAFYDGDAYLALPLRLQAIDEAVGDQIKRNVSDHDLPTSSLVHVCVWGPCEVIRRQETREVIGHMWPWTIGSCTFILSGVGTLKHGHDYAELQSMFGMSARHYLVTYYIYPWARKRKGSDCIAGYPCRDDRLELFIMACISAYVSDDANAF